MRFAARRAGGLTGVFVGAAMAACAVVAVAQDTPRAPDPYDVVGTLSCTSASCHGATPAGNRGLSRQDYVHWLGGDAHFRDGRRSYDPRAEIEKSNADPHALAGQRMQEPPFQEVLRRASLRADGSVDAGMAERCARCHDPMGMASSITLTQMERRESGGIGCESCHGGARQWIAMHYERDVSRERLTQLGMVDTKNLLTRARLCAGCHVGSADQDMNHDMIAAGHPPLRFELASYEALIPRKHWDDGPRRLANPDYEAQLWAAGRIAAAEAALALLEGRARRAAEQTAGKGNAPWPEFAESNCFACHQPLRTAANKLPINTSQGRQSGVAVWQSWNFSLLDTAVANRSCSESLHRLRAAMENSFQPPADEVASLAASALAALRRGIQVDEVGRVLDGAQRPLSASAILQIEPGSPAAMTWDEACHHVAALAAARRSIRDASLQVGSGGSVSVERLHRIGGGLRFMCADREWPAAWSGLLAREGEMPAGMTMMQINQELDAARRELMTTYGRIRPQP